MMEPTRFLEMETGALYCDDNRDRLAKFPTETVDLVYLDPPFFSNRYYEVIWGDEAEIRSFDDRWEKGLGYYIDWMEKRVVELHRVLKGTGSLYLHCDPHASHYLKVMLDSVFGSRARFLSEIIWKRTSAHSSAQRYGPVHDVLLFYSKSDAYTWHPTYQDYDPTTSISSTPTEMRTGGAGDAPISPERGYATARRASPGAVLM